jgi:rhamnogalacturonyl hydrolase YesR
MNRYWLPLLAVLFLCSCAGEPSGPEAVRQLGDRVADWQLGHLDDFSYVRTFRDETQQETSWIRAAFYVGLARWATTTDRSDYVSALVTVAETAGWTLGPRYWHADDQAIAQVYLSLARTGHDAGIGAVTAAFDRVLAAPPDNELSFLSSADGQSEGACQRRWCWCDALFMAPPAWAALSRQTGDPAYLDYALREYWATKAYLYDERRHLFYRDSRFFDRESAYGNRIFWSRGNGWVFAGIPLLLEAMPAAHPDRSRLLALYREMAAAFRELQHPDGYWASSLLDVAHGPLPETSGTAFITFGLAWGINRGFLPAPKYGAVVDRGWRALARAVDEDGRLGWVQQVGNAPGEVRASDTQLYGVGALLLAASEMTGEKR